MSHKIFLSHNHKDKPLVEAVALRLADIFGEEQVFYDSWSIRPGDSIIEKMSIGLEAPEFVFFFVSKNSLDSGMVKLEWQNALYSASKGKTRIIPVRVDGSDMPPILRQTLFIDMHTIGLEAALSQIVSITQGNASFTPQHQGFSNLTYTKETTDDGSIGITIKASHLMEPNPNFLILLKNTKAEVSWEIKNASGFFGGFNENIRLNDGTICNGITMRPMNISLAPGYPIKIQLDKKTETDIGIIGVLHQRSEDNWLTIPLTS